jgi:hypothetical protein
VLEWTGTADSVTSDVVNSWTNSTFTAGNFFLGANLTVAGVGTITPSANTLTDFDLVVDVSSSCNNLIVFMWTEGTAAQNVTLDLAWALLSGDWSASVWPYVRPRHAQQELALCQRYYEELRFDLTSLPTYARGSSAFITDTYAWINFNTTKRVSPTVAGATYNNISGGTTVATIHGVRFGGSATGDASITGRITVSAEL